MFLGVWQMVEARSLKRVRSATEEKDVLADTDIEGDSDVECVETQLDETQLENTEDAVGKQMFLVLSFGLTCICV